MRIDMQWVRNFFVKHPFFTKLVKRIITINVTWLTVVGCLFVTVLIIGAVFGSNDDGSDGSYSYVYGNGSHELLSIKVSGTIVGSDASGSILNQEDETAGYAIKERLYKAADDDLINGVVLEMDSPGGTIYGARAIADGVSYYKKTTGNPVYAYVQGTAASGGYWAISGADKIIADYGSDVGSIGVIMGPFQYYNTVLAEDGGLLSGGVVTQNGIESTYITAGKSKDVGSPYRKLSANEITMLQKSVNNEYDTFVQYVSEHRHIPEATIRDTIGAMAYDNKTAQSYKLIDKTGSRDDAYAALAKAAGIEDDFSIIREEYSPSFVESLLSATLHKPQIKASSNICSQSKGILAYHGDVAALCQTKQ
jgi:protease-4